MNYARTERRLIRSHRTLGYIVSRLIWLVIGPAVLMILAVLKLETHSPEITALDAGFAAVTVGMILLRCFTFLAGDRCDSFGARIRVSGLAVFAALTGGAAGGVWMLVTLLIRQ